MLWILLGCGCAGVSILVISIVAAIAKTQPIPIKLIGIGEGLDDLRAFRAAEFVDALVG